MDKIFILWVEEETYGNQTTNRVGLKTVPNYTLEIVETFEEAKEKMIVSNGYLHYNVIIIDILLPKSREDAARDTYGFALIDLVINLGYSDRLLIFTNEVKEAVIERVPSLNSIQYLNKSDLMGVDHLENIVREIAKRNNTNP